MPTTNLEPNPGVESDISSEWEWVQDLIRDVERQEERENFAKFLFQWDLAVREFRKMESRKVTLSENPSARDLRQHAICLHMLLGLGHIIVLESENFGEEELNQWNIRHDHIKAYVDELEQSFREWHHGYTLEEINSAQKKIFGEA